ncbi:MAG: sigma-54 dependent transcriptional regulator [Candidatus Latescibacteria bacterium]|nr:sigma-54 dependent transcriptional regulator [Candidatus Latescibacterota bacterium]
MPTDITPTILIADDEPEIRKALERIIKHKGFSTKVAADGREALDIIQSDQIDVLLADLQMPRMSGMELLKATKTVNPEIEVIMITGHGGVEDAVEAIKIGAYDFISKPPRKAIIERVIERAAEKQMLDREIQNLRDRLDALESAQEIIGNSSAMKRIMETVHQVASSSATVLILGESGTGKERIADAVHLQSRRKDQPFIKVNCRALPENLLEAEFFGTEKGAYTGASSQRVGRFEAAHEGTLMLDEVSEMTMAMQVKLLRVLQEGEFERLGSTKTIKVDVRLIAATNKNLEEAVKAGTFREDMYYRLNVIPLTLPSLRDRKEDIPLLAHHFLQIYAQKNGKVIKGITPQVLDGLTRYKWPGNVRELENVIERAVVMCTTDEISTDGLPAHISQAEKHAGQLMIPIGTPLKEIEKYVLHQTLDHVGGDVNVAAGLLGIASRTIYRKLGEKRQQGNDSENNLKKT